MFSIFSFIRSLKMITNAIDTWKYRLRTRVVRNEHFLTKGQLTTFLILSAWRRYAFYLQITTTIRRIRIYDTRVPTSDCFPIVISLYVHARQPKLANPSTDVLQWDFGEVARRLDTGVHIGREAYEQICTRRVSTYIFKFRTCAVYNSSIRAYNNFRGYTAQNNEKNRTVYPLTRDW